VSYMAIMIAILSMVMFLPFVNTAAAAAEPFSIPLSPATSVTTPTYDGSGQATHPDVYYNANGWRGYKYWMVMTPYPNGDSAYENPSVLVSNDGISWIVPSGLKNPIDPKPASGSNSDVDIEYNAILDRLEIYYVESGGGNSILMRRTTTDGINWSPEEIALTVPDYQIMSPAIVTSGSVYDMWYTGGANCNSDITVKYRTSTNGLSWSSAQAVNIHPGVNVWHMDVKFIPAVGEYWMIYAAYPKGSTCGNTDLYFAKSKDKINWEASGNKIIPRASYYSSQVYRSTFDVSGDLLKIWISGRTSNNVWHIGYTSSQITIVPTPTPSPTPTVTPTPSPTPPLPLAGFWSLNEGSGTVAADSSGNGNNVNLVNGPIWINGKSGKALQFDGVNDYAIKTSASGIPVNPPFSVIVWINGKSLSNPKWNDIVRKEGSWAVQADPYGKLNLEITGKQDTISKVGIPTNVWTHIAVTFEGTTVKFYNNGMLGDTKTQTNKPNAGLNTINIGGYTTWGTYFNGALDEVKIYNKALNATEINADYTAPTTPTP